MSEQPHGQHLGSWQSAAATPSPLAGGSRTAGSEARSRPPVPDLSGSLDEAADDSVARDDQVLHWVRRRAEHARQLVRTVTVSLIATINHKDPT
jgi:hypothetical protein